MTINIKAPELRELKPRIMVCGVGGAGGNAVNNMIVSGLVGVDFVVANTDAQALASSRAERIIQMGLQVTEGLGAGSKPEVGRAAAEEALEEIRDHLAGAHMVFVTAGMGGGTGTGAAPVIARAAREMGILTVGVVTKPFHFEGGRRMRLAEGGIAELHKSVDTLIIIPNQNLFRVANEKTTFADAFSMADQVLYSGVACITDLMVKEGLINLDFADVRSIMSEMGKAMMGTGEATGERRAVQAAEAAISNPLLDEVSMKGARGLLISITGGNDLTLYEVDEAASRIRQEVDEEANIILGATFDSALDGVVRVSVVATGIDQATLERADPLPSQRRRGPVARSAIDVRRAAVARRRRRRRRSRSSDAGRQRPRSPRRRPRRKSRSGRRPRRSPSRVAPADDEEDDRRGFHSPRAGADRPRAAHADDRGTARRRAAAAAPGARRNPAAAAAAGAPPLAAGEARRFRHQPSGGRQRRGRPRRSRPPRQLRRAGRRALAAARRRRRGRAQGQLDAAGPPDAARGRQRRRPAWRSPPSCAVPAGLDSAAPPPRFGRER